MKREKGMIYSSTITQMSGGLALPNILFYIRANHVRIAAQQLNEYLEITDSCDICCCTSFTMLSLLTKDITQAPAVITQNPFNR